MRFILHRHPHPQSRFLSVVEKMAFATPRLCMREIIGCFARVKPTTIAPHLRTRKCYRWLSFLSWGEVVVLEIKSLGSVADTLFS